MSLGTKNIRHDARRYIGTPFVAEVLQLCDELEQARADVLKLRTALAQYQDGPNGKDGYEGEWWQGTDRDSWWCDFGAPVLADTEHYEQYR